MILSVFATLIVVAIALPFLKTDVLTESITIFISALFGMVITKQLSSLRSEIISKERIIDSTFENSPSFMYIKDVTGRYLRVNQQFEKVFGKTREDVIGKTDNELFETETAEQFRSSELAVIQTKRTITSEKKVHLSNGSHHFVTTKFPLFDTEGKVYATCSVATDVTQEKFAQGALRKAAETAERASQIKSEFLANMSHEIRTPMNAIMGMAELLNETHLNDEQQRYVNIFRKAGENLLSIINDILDISKIEAGHLKVEYMDFNLRDLIEDVAELAAPRAFAKNLEVFCHIDSTLENGFNGDPFRIRQVVMNLVGNAIKFTTSGEVRITVTPNTEPEKHGNLLFAVSDTGVGIPEKAQTNLFQYFQQADGSVTKKFGGTGLGLAICKKLVEMMGGDIWLKSIPFEGTTFYFTLSCANAAQVKDQKILDITKNLKDKNVLIIGDRPTNRKILKEMLIPYGISITETDNWAAGWEHMQSKKFDLALTEFKLLNGEDAINFVSKVKKADAYKNTGIILLSSDYVDVTRVELYEMGVATVLYKPTRRDQLLREMAKALMLDTSKEATGVVTAAKSQSLPAASGSAYSILLVDDSEDNRILIITYLKKSGHSIVQAENGAEAVAKAKHGNFDIILMDMQMPVMDGYSATKAIREWETENKLKSVPIIALTAYALKEEQEKSYAAGCNKHISKPVSKQQILDAVEEYCTSKKQAA